MVLNQTLRENARAQLGGKLFCDEWLTVTLACFIVNAVLTAVTGAFAPAALILSGPIYYGLAKGLIRMIEERKKQFEFEDLLKGFNDCFTQSALLYFLKSVFIALWSLLFVIPGIVKAYAYSMSEFVLQDTSTKTWKEALEESKQLTEGYKMQLFTLDLSFFGWYFLGLLCFGVGILFVVPYHQMARANFYLARKADVFGTPVAYIP